MSSYLGLERTLELLDRLNSVVRSSMTRADQLEQELRQNSSRIHWQFDQEVKELESRFSLPVAEADASFQAGKERLESRHRQRNAGMLRAKTTARKQQLKRIESHEGRQINEVQRELLQTSRHQEAEQKRIAGHFTSFQEELAREQDALAVLERRSRAALRGYIRFQRLLDSPHESSSELDLADRTVAPSSSPDNGSEALRRAGESGGQRKKEEANATADEYRLLEEFRALLAQTKRRLGWFRISPLPLLFSLLPLWLFVPLLLVGHIAAVPVISRFGGRVFTWPQAAISFVACLGGVLALHWLGRLMAGASARRLAAALGRARARLDACRETAEANHQKESERIRREAGATSSSNTGTRRLTKRKRCAMTCSVTSTPNCHVPRPGTISSFNMAWNVCNRSATTRSAA